MSKIRFRRHLSMPQLLSMAGRVFESIPDPVTHRGFSLRDCLLSGMAVFFLKMPSLLQFDNKTRGRIDDPSVPFNLRSLFGVAKAPSDSLRERLDRIDPVHLRPAFSSIFARLQRAKVLEHFATLDGHYLLSLDGTGYYSSKKDPLFLLLCQEPPERNQDLPAPDDGRCPCPSRLQDCHSPGSRDDHQGRTETTRTTVNATPPSGSSPNSGKTIPTSRTIVVEDALASNGPHIEHLRDNNIRFILGVKPGDPQVPFRLGRQPSGCPDPHRGPNGPRKGS